MGQFIKFAALETDSRKKQIKRILKIIEPIGKDMNWYILLDLEINNYTGDKFNVREFEQTVLDSEHGILLQWDEIMDLSDHVLQFIWLNLAGCRNKSNIPNKGPYKEQFEKCDVAIVIFDSSFWVVFSKNENIISNLSYQFPSNEISEDSPI